MTRVAPELLDPRRYPLAHEITTRYADIDANMHLNNVAFAIAFEDARVRTIDEKDIRDRFPGHRVMIASASIDFLAEGHYPDVLTIRTGVLEIGNRSWTLAQLAMQGERVCAYSRAVAVIVGEDRAVPIPEPLRVRLEAQRLGPVAGKGS